MLSKEQIKNAPTAKIEKVDLPEWAESLGVPVEESFVYVKALDGHSLKALAELQDKGQDHKIYLLILSLCDESGNTLFDLSDMDWLLKKPMSSLVKVLEVASRLNGLGPEALDELRKN